MTTTYQRIGEAMADADTVVALTGAGVSTASGIPSFRGDDGIWDRYEPDAFTIWRFERDPDGFWTDWVDLHDEVFAQSPVEPNPAHEALATLESRGVLDAVLTQNVDGLHSDAGSERVIELHGNGEQVVCRQCGRRVAAETVLERARGEEAAPVCRSCGGPLKPAAVLFGESLPEAAYREARTLAEDSDVFLAIGSSLTVEPAASLPERAHDTGATVVVANDESTPMEARADEILRESVTDALPALASPVAPDE